MPVSNGHGGKGEELGTSGIQQMVIRSSVLEEGVTSGVTYLKKFFLVGTKNRVREVSAGYLDLTTRESETLSFLLFSFLYLFSSPPLPLPHPFFPLSFLFVLFL